MTVIFTSELCEVKSMFIKVQAALRWEGMQIYWGIASVFKQSCEAEMIWAEGAVL